jgi:hypothetical protein
MDFKGILVGEHRLEGELSVVEGLRVIFDV